MSSTLTESNKSVDLFKFCSYICKILIRCLISFNSIWWHDLASLSWQKSIVYRCVKSRHFLLALDIRSRWPLIIIAEWVLHVACQGVLWSDIMFSRFDAMIKLRLTANDINGWNKVTDHLGQLGDVCCRDYHYQANSRQFPVWCLNCNVQIIRLQVCYFYDMDV